MSVWLDDRALDPNLVVAALRKWQHRISQEFADYDDEAHVNRIADAAWLWVAAMEERGFVVVDRGSADIAGDDTQRQVGSDTP